MKKLKILSIVLMIPLVWGCTSKKKTSKPGDKVTVKEAYLRVVTALRQCDRRKLQTLVTPKTWALATKMHKGHGDLIDLMCKNTVKGDVQFEDVTIDNDHASLMVKLGNQPPKEVEMSKINNKWLMGQPGKAPAVTKRMSARKPSINPVIIKQLVKKPHFKVTNLHIGVKLTPGSGHKGHKTAGTGQQHKPAK